MQLTHCVLNLPNILLSGRFEFFGFLICLIASQVLYANNSCFANDNLDVANIGNLIWFDYDYDGNYDIGEPGAKNVVLTLLDEGGEILLGQTSSDSIGTYVFKNIGPGSYVLRVSFQSLLNYLPVAKDLSFNLIEEGTYESLPFIFDPKTGSDLSKDIGIQPNCTKVYAGPDIQTQKGQPVQLQASKGQQYRWSPERDLSCVNCPNPIATPFESTYFVVESVTADLCVRYDTVFVEVYGLIGPTTIPGWDELSPINLCESFIEKEFDILELNTSNELINYSVDIPFWDYEYYEIFDNEIPFTGSASPCNYKFEIMYDMAPISGNGISTGPYFLEAWKIAGITYSGTFETLYDLVDSMNHWDPKGGWILDVPKANLYSVQEHSDFGVLKVTQPFRGQSAIFAS